MSATKTKKSFDQSWRGSYIAIAHKLGCSPIYVSLVLRDKLGKYTNRNTELVKKIKETALELDKMFKPEVKS
jgi:hypothetical protein